MRSFVVVRHHGWSFLFNLKFLMIAIPVWLCCLGLSSFVVSLVYAFCASAFWGEGSIEIAIQQSGSSGSSAHIKKLCITFYRSHVYRWHAVLTAFNLHFQVCFFSQRIFQHCVNLILNVFSQKECFFLKKHTQVFFGYYSLLFE